MSEITFDHERAKEVMRTAHLAYRNRTHLYKEVHGGNGDAPQRKYRPSGVRLGSRDDLIRLFFAALTDRRQVSSEVYKAHVRLWEKHQWLYREKILKVGFPQTLEPLLREEKVGVPVESAKNWVRCGETLYRMFGGDPLKMYESESVDGALKWIAEKEEELGYNPLPGFGPKILSLLAIFYEELGALKHVDGAFPVDVHIQRIFISNGVVTAKGLVRSAEFAEFLRPRLCEICYENKWKPLNLSHAFWFLGNQTCTECWKFKDIHARCPIYDSCGGALESRSYFESGQWDFDSPRRTKGVPVMLLF